MKEYVATTECAGSPASREETGPDSHLRRALKDGNQTVINKEGEEHPETEMLDHRLGRDH